MIDRIQEKEFLEKKFRSENAELVVIYGRRRVGKTFLLENTFPGALFLTADMSEPQQLINRFSIPLKEKAELPLSLEVTKWDEMFSLLEKMIKLSREKLVIVWDEFQYIPIKDDSFLSLFQRWWDQVFSKLPVMMVLCGSFIGMMERITLAESSPIYGRRTGQYRIDPMGFLQARKFLPDLNMEDQVKTYSAVGGIPLYLKKMSGHGSFNNALKESMLSPGEFLVEEGRFLVMEEFKKDPTSYFSILRTIAKGRTRASEIAQITGIPHQNISTYLRNLLELGLIRKELPFSLKRPKKIPLYFIEDEYLRFYFRYLLDDQELIYRERGSDVQEKISSTLSMHTSFTWEKICRQVLKDWINPEGMGRWWDGEDEVDIVAVKGETLVLGECKWTREPANSRVFMDLAGKADKIRKVVGRDCSRTVFYIFSRSGFKGLESSEDINLVRLEDLVCENGRS